MWVGIDCPSDILQSLFGVSSLLECLSQELRLIDQPNEFLTRVKTIIATAQSDPPYKPLFIFRQVSVLDKLRQMLNPNSRL
jgi:hypothetical protein